MAYRVVRAEAAICDLELIFDHLVESYAALGDEVETALERAANRLREIDGEMEALGRAPFQGTLQPKLMAGLRNVTKNKAVIYFHVDENAEMIRVVAVFFGGQDHQRHMLMGMGADV